MNDVDFFEIDLFETDTVVETSQSYETIAPKLIIESMQEFFNLFTGDTERISLGTYGLTLLQHLAGAGYKTDIELTDSSATLQAESHQHEQVDALLDRIETILSEMTHAFPNADLESFAPTKIKYFNTGSNQGIELLIEQI